MNRVPKEEIAAIALGSNLGDSAAILEGAIAEIKQVERVTVLSLSPWYRTKPVGPPQPDYINGCMLVHYLGQAEELMRMLLKIEQRYGRERTVRWGPRTLDLDLIFFGSTLLNTDFLTLPHPRMHERRFVLEPLIDLYPDWIHPRFSQSAQQLLTQLNQLDQ